MKNLAYLLGKTGIRAQLVINLLFFLYCLLFALASQDKRYILELLIVFLIPVFFNIIALILIKKLDFNKISSSIVLFFLTILTDLFPQIILHISFYSRTITTFFLSYLQTILNFSNSSNIVHYLPIILVLIASIIFYFSRNTCKY